MHNLYYRLDGAPAIVAAGGEELVLDQWSQLTGSDLRSRFVDPQLHRAENFNFSFSAESPWLQRSAWPVRTLQDVAGQPEE